MIESPAKKGGEQPGARGDEPLEEGIPQTDDVLAVCSVQRDADGNRDELLSEGRPVSDDVDGDTGHPGPQGAFGSPGVLHWRCSRLTKSI